MLRTRRAVVTAITRAGAATVYLRTLSEGESTERSVVAYPGLTGPIQTGDAVLLNVTATALALGTGGVDFVMANLSASDAAAVFGAAEGDEHIVKLRYTPHQHAVRAVEMDPAYAGAWETASSLDSTPVVVCGLHSQIGPVAAGVKAACPEARVAYLMTDSAALPFAFSRLAAQLREVGLLDATLTAGQAFGAEYECVSNASALIAARHIAGAEVIVVAPGPGNAGTGTPLGFSSVEQGPLLTLAGALGGEAIAVLRLSLADPRPRHRGLSHHSVTAIGRLAQPCHVAFPARPDGIRSADYEAVWRAVQDSEIGRRHTVVEAGGAHGLRLLELKGITARSMRRTVADDPIFFHAAAAAGAVAARSL